MTGKNGDRWQGRDLDPEAWETPMERMRYEAICEEQEREEEENDD